MFYRFLLGARAVYCDLLVYLGSIKLILIDFGTAAAAAAGRGADVRK